MPTLIHKITTNTQHILVIESDKTARLYEWISEGWEPIDPQSVNKDDLSGKTHVQVIVLNR